MVELPREIMDNIFSRLPVKLLLRFRCVSKLWCNIIDDPCLANMHRTQAGDEEPLVLLLLGFHDRTEMSSLYELEDNRGVLRPITSNKQPLLNLESKETENGIEQYYLQSFCKGLLCISSLSKVILSNPLRKESLILPPVTLEYKSMPNFESYGLGFDTSTNMYKAVHVFYKEIDFDTMRYKLGTQVYSLGSTSWREISSTPSYPIWKPIYVNEAIHWIADTRFEIDNLKGMIVSFDIGKEEFQLTPHPAGIHIDSFHPCYLINLRRDLAIVESQSCSASVVIWVLKNWNTKQWVKEFSLYIAAPSMYLGNSYISSVCPSEGGLIFKDGGTSTVAHYKLGSDEVEWYKICKLTGSKRMDLLQVFSFKGSLISLKSYGKLL